MKIALGIFFLTGALSFAQPKLGVTAATNRQVDLTWTGINGAAVLERRPMGTPKYQPLATVKDGQSYRDAAIDAMATYQYRVHAEAPNAAGSNEVTVGPPPAGYTVALPTPKKVIAKDAQANFGKATAMDLDSNGDPAFVFTNVDPAFQGSNDTDLLFLHWDRAHWRWQQPVKIATFVPARTGAVVARDAQSGAWATIAEAESQLRLFVSTDDGATWSQKHEIKDTDHSIAGRAVALSGGRVFWGYSIDSLGTFLLSGDLATPPSKWKAELLPMPSTYTRGPAASSLSVAVDSQGKPGMTYFGYGPDYNVTALYWRPGMSAPIKIQDSDGVQNDLHTALVTYQGAPKDQAKFLVELNRVKGGTTDPQIWVGWERGGSVALAPAIPTDGGHHTLNAPFDASFDSKGNGAAAITRSGSGTGDDKCGAPKLTRGTSTTAWKTCSPDPRRDMQAASLAWGLALRHAVNDKLYAAFATASGPLGPGLILWREP